MYKFVKSAIVISAMMIVSSGNVLAAGNVKAGPIWNNQDAAVKCPQVCGSLQWNGNKDIQGGRSLCFVANGDPENQVAMVVEGNSTFRDNPYHIIKICQELLRQSTWTGNWITTIPGQMSVCTCKGVAE